jgi:predicted Zn-dependent protease
MPRGALLAVVSLLLVGCASVPDGAYMAGPGERTTRVANTLYRAAQAAGENPASYSFALVDSSLVFAVSGDEEGVFYFSDGLAALPAAHLDALVAREVAHEVLGHAGQRRVLWWSITAVFTAVGIVVPGLSLASWVVNPLVVRAFEREQVIAADVRAIEILRAMGHEHPRRTLAAALTAVDARTRPALTPLLAHAPPLEDRLAAIGPPEPLSDLTQVK